MQGLGIRAQGFSSWFQDLDFSAPGFMQYPKGPKDLRIMYLGYG